MREYLISTYERVVRDWGFDGVKLDFIDSFRLPNPDRAVAENYAGRDYRSLPEAVDRLMKDVLGRPAGKASAAKGLTRLAVPASGYAKIAWSR